MQHKRGQSQKRKAMTTVNSWPIFKRGTWFTVSHGVLRLQTPFQLLWFFICPQPPTTPSLNPADGSSFVHQHPGNNIKGLLGVNAECLKNKTKLKNKEVPEGMGDIHSNTPERKGEKELLCAGGNKQTRRKKERKNERTKERKRHPNLLGSVCQTLIIIYWIHKGVGWVILGLMTTINKWKKWH